MADLQKTIEIIFFGTDRTGPALDSFGNELQNLEGSIGSVTGPLADLSAKVLTAETAILAAGATMAGVAINEAGQFHDSVTEIGTLFNGTTEQVDALSGQILTFSRDSVNSIDDINSSVYQAISTGTDWSESVELVAQAEQLAKAGRADLVEVTNLLTSSMNAYGVSTDQAADYSDVLFTAVQVGRTTIPELATSLGAVTGIASAAKVPFDDLVAALAALTVTNGTTAESSTQLKALLNELLSPSDELKEALSGVTLAGDGLDGVMARLKVVTGGSAEEMVQLFGSTEAVQAALTLANDNARRYNDALEAMADRTGVVSNAAEAMADNFRNINQTLLNNITVTLVEFGGPLLDGYRDVAEAIGNIFEGVSIGLGDGAFDELYSAFDAASEDLTELLQGIAEALPVALSGVNFEGLLDSLRDLGTSISGVFEGLDLTKPEDLKTAIQFLIDSIESLTRSSAGIVEGWRPFVQLITDAVNGVNNADDGLVSLVGKILGFAQGLDSTLIPALQVAGSALSGISETIVILAGARYLGAATTGFAGLATSVGALATALHAGPAALLAALGFAVAGFSNLYESVQRTNSLIEENRHNVENWVTAFSEGETWEAAVVRASELGESVSHLNDVFVHSFGVTADAVAQYGSVEEAQRALIEQYGSLEEAEKARQESLEETTTKVETAEEIMDRLYQAHLQELEASGALATNYERLVESLSAQTSGSELLNRSISDLATEYGAMSEAQRGTLSSGQDFVYQAAEWALANGRVSGTTEDAVAAFNEHKRSTEALADAYRVMSLAERAALSPEERRLYVNALESATAANNSTADSTRALTQAEVEAKLSAQELAELRLEQMRATQDFQLALEELASDERLQAMEFAFNLDIAQLEADTERAVAIVETMNTTIQSTGELLGSLFGHLLEADSFSERWAIEEQIDLENRRREEALELQRELTEAQIRYMDAQIDAMESGEALISIQAEGLEPELRAFMYRILDNIRVEMTRDNLAFITGVPMS